MIPTPTIVTYEAGVWSGTPALTMSAGWTLNSFRGASYPGGMTWFTVHVTRTGGALPITGTSGQMTDVAVVATLDAAWRHSGPDSRAIHFYQQTTYGTGIQNTNGTVFLTAQAPLFIFPNNQKMSWWMVYPSPGVMPAL